MRLILLTVFLYGCTTQPSPEVPAVVLKTTWKYCWEKCGKKDSLAAVSNNACVCENGGVIPLQGKIPELAPEKSLFEKLTAYFKGE